VGVTGEASGAGASGCWCRNIRGHQGEVAASGPHAAASSVARVAACSEEIVRESGRHATSTK
jgi:hypothetical protein